MIYFNRLSLSLALILRQSEYIMAEFTQTIKKFLEALDREGAFSIEEADLQFLVRLAQALADSASFEEIDQMFAEDSGMTHNKSRYRETYIEFAGKMRRKNDFRILK